MNKFKVGDRVIGNKDASKHYAITVEGWKGVVTKVRDGILGIKDDKGSEFFVRPDCFDLDKVKRSEKSETIQFIAFYDERGGDPAKRFSSKKELNKWLCEAKDDENIIFSSIRVYPVKGEKKIKMSFSLREV